jgi:diguanylate cyclase (GGDEF)-like protein/putative nucleotidyltransferase with HDIG domain
MKTRNWIAAAAGRASRGGAPTAVSYGTMPASNRGRRQGDARLSGRAALFLFAVAVATVATAAEPLSQLGTGTRGWGTFLVLATAAAVAQLFAARAPQNAARYYTTVVFLIAGVLLLPAGLVALLGVVQHVPEWIKLRHPWYVQTFNILNYTLSCLAAWAAVHLVLDPAGGLSAGGRWAAAAAVACIVFVVVNHALLAAMMHFAGHRRIWKSELFSLESLSTDLTLAALGAGFATLWVTNRWLVLAVVAPLMLIHRSLNVAALEEEARIDSKTGLFNARYFAAELREELERAQRLGRPTSVVMADLDLLRDINNSYGHLAGDAVLRGVAHVFRAQLRDSDVPARFGGEEFAILLPDTPPERALEIADRIRRAVAAETFVPPGSKERISATISCGVAGFPKDGTDVNEVVHQADVAVYRAKLQGRNRALAASSEPQLAPADRGARLAAVPETPATARGPEAAGPPLVDRRRSDARRHMPVGPRFLALSTRIGALAGLVAFGGVGAGVVALVLAESVDVVALAAVMLAVAVGHALSQELEGSAVSASVVGALAGAAMFGPAAALPLALTVAAVHWSVVRHSAHQAFFNAGVFTLASLAAAGVFSLGWEHDDLGRLLTALAGLAAGGAYFLVKTGLFSGAMALEGSDRWWGVWNERFSWLLPRYAAFGLIGGAIALAYEALGLYGLAVFALPLLLMLKTMAAYIGHMRLSSEKLSKAADTIRVQNTSLEQANRLLRERSTAAMESLSATVDARDAYTAGHSRRVLDLALALGRELGLSREELDLLGRAALFHDIGKLAVPDAILLKPGPLDADEWAAMQRHAEEGAQIIDRLGFLDDAVPAIRHHHERFDGSGYPDGVRGTEIPLGARIIHLADAVDSMMTTRIYRAARSVPAVVDEVRAGTGTQFCPSCVAALDRLIDKDGLVHLGIRIPALATAS